MFNLKNLWAFAFFQLLPKLSTLELPNLKITQLSILVIPIKQLRSINISNLSQ